jgi:uncharacterized delta-60 repeat protein
MKIKSWINFRPIPSRWRGLILGASLSALPIVAGAAAGDLDTTFDGDGMVTTTVGSSSYATAVKIQSDGKIVVAGVSDNGSDNDFVVARYNSDGSLDSGFGVGGKVTTSFSSSGDAANAIAIQSDGKIVVAGYESSSGVPKFAMARYNSNGTLDTSFSGDGKATHSFGSAVYDGRAVALQSDGKIVVAGYKDPPGANLIDSFALARFATNGNLDTTFGYSGEEVANFSVSNDRGYGMAIQNDDKIVVAGTASVSSSPDFGVMRFNANGSLDTSFSGDGKSGKATVTLGGNDHGRAVALQSDGKIVVAGFTDVFGANRFALARFNTDGSLDTTFNGNGRVITAVGSSDAYAYAVAIQSDGKIVVGGAANTGLLASDFAVVRYNSNGSLDTGFGTGGIVITSPFYSVNGIAIQGDGKIVAAGSSGFSGHIAVARYQGPTITSPPLFPPPATTLPVPVGANTYACEAVPTNPVVSATPASADPMGVSNPTAVDVRVTLQTEAFAAAVDVYVTARLADGSTVIRTPSGWAPYPATTTPLFAVQTAAIDMTSAGNNLYAAPLASLPPGNYQGNVIVVPTGAGLASPAFYNWCYTKTFP